MIYWLIGSFFRFGEVVGRFFEMGTFMKMKVCVHSDVDIIFTYICLHILVLHTSKN